MTPLRVVAVDDEPLALRRIELLLARIPNVELVATALGGREALARIVELKPDVILLDIKMAGIGGFDVVEQLSGPYVPLVIFVTAFEGFAVKAFDVRALDYIVKPVELTRLTEALDRARQSLAAADAEMRAAELRSVVAALREERAGEAQPRYVSELWAEGGGQFVRIIVSNIDWIEAERDYVRIHVGSKSYLRREAITRLQERLDPKLFIRVRRSALVKLDQVAGIRCEGYGDYRVSLRSGENVRVGRTYVKQVRALITPRTVDAG